MSGNVINLNSNTTDAELRALGFVRDALGGWRMAVPCEVLLERTPGGTWQFDVVSRSGSIGVESDHIDFRRES